MLGKIRAATGDVDAETIGFCLPHEHVYTDLRPLTGRVEAVPIESDVLGANVPLLVEAKEAGVGLLVECTPPGIGRQPSLYRRVSELSGVAIVVSTGLYKEPLLPAFAYEWDEDRIAAWMTAEIVEGIDGTDVRAGVIKLATSDASFQSVERKALRAAASASRSTGAAIISHTPNGRIALEQLRALEGAGGDPARFVVVHASSEPDLSLNLEAARLGAWIEYDNIGASPDDVMIDRIRRVLDAGFGRQLLLSQDVCGWIVERPANTRRFAYLITDFAPKLRTAGVPADTIAALLSSNPLRLLSLGSVA
jgi:phosphotriesterase-related protein